MRTLRACLDPMFLHLLAHPCSTGVEQHFMIIAGIVLLAMWV